MSWKDAGFVVASKNRRAVLLKLEVPSTPTILAKALELNLANVSRTLRELEKRKLIVCLNPNDRVGRIYSLTESGKIISEKVKNMH